MAEAAVYYYETEIDWKGEKDLRLGGGKLPVIGAGAPPEFKGKEDNWSPEHLFVASLNTCYTLTLLAIAEFSKIALVSVSSTAKGKLEKVQGGGLSNYRNRRKAASCSLFGERSDAHAANPGKSQRELFRLQLDQKRHQNRAGGLSSADAGFALSAGRISAFQHLTMRAESHEGL